MTPVLEPAVAALSQGMSPTENTEIVDPAAAAAARKQMRDAAIEVAIRAKYDANYEPGVWDRFVADPSLNLFHPNYHRATVWPMVDALIDAGLLLPTTVKQG